MRDASYARAVAATLTEFDLRLEALQAAISAGDEAAAASHRDWLDSDLAARESAVGAR